jgi:hypothetical protein
VNQPKCSWAGPARSSLLGPVSAARSSLKNNIYMYSLKSEFWIWTYLGFKFPRVLGIQI